MSEASQEGLNYRSQEITQGSVRPAHRALLFSLGLTRDDMDKPFIAIVNSWNEIVPGCVHLGDLAAAAKQGVREAGGVPFEFNTIGVCDGMAQGHVGMRYSLPSREIIAASIEIMLEAHRFDGAVFIASCDKITPAMLMAAARVNIPSILIGPGAMQDGVYEDRHICLSNTREFAGRYETGKMTLEQLYDMEEHACPTPGACPMMGTASTMLCIAEALGMTYPLSATAPAQSSFKLQEAKRAGTGVIQLIRDNIRPRDIMTRAAFENALRLSMGVGGSTNSVLHIPAIADEAGIELTMRDIERFSETTPYVACVNPSGTATVNDLHADGGVPAVLKALGNLVHPEPLTVSGITMGERVEKAAWNHTGVIHDVSEPIAPTGGLVVMHGSLAPNGAIVKKSAVNPKMHQHRGPARVFESMEDAIEAVRGSKVAPGSVIVIRYEGPVGGPGMREMQMITAIMMGMGLSDNTALVTDGRFSGSTRGPCIGHISPEAALGGPIAFVRDGDMISIDIPAHQLEIEVSSEELSRRHEGWQPPKRTTRGVLGLYAQVATSASEGAIWRRSDSRSR